MFTVPQLIILIAAISGSAWMVAVLGWILNRLKRLEEGAPGKIDRATESLREQLDEVGRRMVELEERLDFSEALLGRGSDEATAGRTEPPGSEYNRSSTDIVP